MSDFDYDYNVCGGRYKMKNIGYGRTNTNCEDPLHTHIALHKCIHPMYQSQEIAATAKIK